MLSWYTHCAVSGKQRNKESASILPIEEGKNPFLVCMNSIYMAVRISPLLSRMKKCDDGVSLPQVETKRTIKLNRKKLDPIAALGPATTTAEYRSRKRKSLNDILAGTFSVY